MTEVRTFMPAIYSQRDEIVNSNYPIFKIEVGNFCDSVNESAQTVIAKSKRHLTISDFLPKVNIKIFGAFSNTTITNERHDTSEMDGPARAVSLLVGGLVAALATFVFGSFYSDLQEARIRIDRCENFREEFGDVFVIKNHDHIKDLNSIVSTEERLAREEKRSSLYNMALTVGFIGTGALLITAAIFASAPMAIAAAVSLIVLGVVVMAKFGLNFYDKMPARKAQQVADAVLRLQQANTRIEAQMPRHLLAGSRGLSLNPVYA